MSEGFLIFATQVSIAGSLFILSFIYLSVAVAQVLGFAYTKLAEGMNAGLSIARSYRRAATNKPSVSTKTKMIGV